MGITRRKFLCGLPATVAGITTAGAALESAGCAIAASYQVTAPEGRVSIPIVEVEGLMGEMSALILRGTDLPEDVLLLRQPSGFTAVGTTCTHLGCSVRPGQGQLRCPCHGSSFDLTGSVIRGPAQRPLNQYPVLVSGDELTIDVAGV